MNKFTSSERRGTIVVLAIIACIIAYMAIANGIGRKAPDAPVTVQTSFDSGVDTTEYSRDRHSGKTKERSKSNKTRKSEKKKRPTHSETDKSRDPLSEPVTK